MTKRENNDPENTDARGLTRRNFVTSMTAATSTLMLSQLLEPDITLADDTSLEGDPKDPYADLAKQIGEEVADEMIAEAAEALRPTGRTLSEFQEAVNGIGTTQQIATARKSLAAQVKSRDVRLGRYRNEIASDSSNGVLSTVYAKRASQPSPLTEANVLSFKALASQEKAAAASGFKGIHLTLKSVKLTKTYELFKNEVYVGGVKVDFGGTTSTIKAMKLGDIKKGKTKTFDPAKIIASVSFSSVEGYPSACSCMLLFSEHDLGEKHEKVIKKAVDATKKYLTEALKKAAVKLGMSLGALLQSKILGQILGAILSAVLGWALNKFFNWVIGLIGDEVAKPVLLKFNAGSAKPWGSADKGGVHTKSASDTGIGFQFTYQWTAWK